MKNRNFYFVLIFDIGKYGKPWVIKNVNTITEAMQKAKEEIEASEHLTKVFKLHNASVLVGPYKDFRHFNYTIPPTLRAQVVAWAVLKGYTSSIAETLADAVSAKDISGIADNNKKERETVKGELKIIYTDLGIHTRQELIFHVLSELKIIPDLE